MTLNTILKLANMGDEQSIITLISKFEPLIKKYARDLNYEEAETDLIISILEVLPKLDSKINFEANEGKLVNYIQALLKNKKIDLFRKKVKRDYFEYTNSELLEYIEDSTNNFELIDFVHDLNLLSHKQKKVIILKFIDGYNDTEIAKILNISRQSVYNLKKSALVKLEYLLN